MKNVKIKLIIFDLDGVLVDAREIHYEALNKALDVYGGKYVITREEHLSKYDGLNTRRKLELLTIEKGLPDQYHETIFNLKQKYTIDIIENMSEDWRLRKVLSSLKDRGYTLAVASNSIRQTLKMMLIRTGLIDYIDFFLSNEDVINPKPASEIYLSCMIKAGVSPVETLIVEDSPTGRKAAINSGAHVMGVYNTKDVTLNNINMNLEKIDGNRKILPWVDPNLNILIPMAGLGSRFEKTGYTFPKPLIDVQGKPMIQLIVENLNIKGHFIFVVQKSHYEKYSLQTLLNLIAPGCDIIQVDGLTEGAACTVMLAKEFIDNDKSLVIANSDQVLDWNSSDFMWNMNSDHIDGGIVTFNATHPKWSFAKVNENGWITEVAEKNPISDIATVGVYYWKRGSNCISAISQMIESNIRTNGEFYLAPSYNELINRGLAIKNYHIDKFYGIGTPEDLNYYLSLQNK